MSEYLENIKSMELVGTGIETPKPPEYAMVLEMSGEAPITTYGERQTPTDEKSQDPVPYSAPQKVIVRKYRLRK